MKTPRHTAGIWRSGISAGNLVVVDEESTILASLPSSKEDRQIAGYTPESHANAMLIAAAPDLLEAVKSSVEWLDLIKQDYPEMRGLIEGLEKGEAAIAKAEGRPS